MVVIINLFQLPTHEVRCNLVHGYPSSHIPPHSPSTLCVLATLSHTQFALKQPIFFVTLLSLHVVPFQDGQILSPNPPLTLSLEQELASFFCFCFLQRARRPILGCGMWYP